MQACHAVLQEEEIHRKKLNIECYLSMYTNLPRYLQPTTYLPATYLPTYLLTYDPGTIICLHTYYVTRLLATERRDTCSRGSGL
jgi:hypothetical protein